jgi:hypothetical protein
MMDHDIRNLVRHCETCNQNMQPETTTRRHPKKRYAETIINVSAGITTKKRSTRNEETNPKKMRYTYGNGAIGQKMC